MIYDYHCEACEQDLEIEHSIKDKPKSECPLCGEEKLRRMISTDNKNSFVLAGECWEKDGYTKNND